MIPNTVYDFNSKQLNNYTEKFSSYFKDIRYVISILNKDTKNNYRERYVKGNIPDDEDKKDMLERYDGYIINKNKIYSADY